MGCFGAIGIVVLAIYSAEPLAFPEAEGFGKETPGGRGGKILFVTNLDDKGPGSLRAAVDAKGPRIILFRVAGTIELKSDLKITEPFCTIAGQSAPGGGICIKGKALGIRGHDVIVRYLRLRPGDIGGKELDGLDVTAENVMVDHCSVSWGIDETLSVTNSNKVTVQWCFITESLNKSLHKKGEHGYGSLISGADGGITYHHNLYAHHKSRNPRPGGKPDSNGILLDFTNNVIYDWGSTAGYTSETAVRVNYIGNFLKPGPSTKPDARNRAFTLGGSATHLYVQGNELDGFVPPHSEIELLGITKQQDRFPKDYTVAGGLAKSPFPSPLPSIEPAEKAVERVLREGGAVHPIRDAIDERIVNEYQQSSGHIINSQNEVGGWPALASGEPSLDSDNDGMPNVWEEKHGLDSKNPADANADADQDGYTNIEEFLNGSEVGGEATK
ncbi:pectate lyase [bacterium]|nr:pectate lyase [bacterium]